MPILNVKVSASKTSVLTAQINDLLLDITSRILKKKADVTAIAIEYIPPECWSIGGIPLSETKQKSIYLDIKITDETNTKDEKAHYIAEAFNGFRKILGDLHSTSYVHVHDIRAAAYGFGGKTQEFRYHQPD